MAFAGYTPLPSRLHARLKYITYNVGSGGVTPSVYVLSANGLFDPDITGVGHQPRGFDQLIALYDHYVVEKSHCTVEFCPNGTSSGAITVSGIQLQSSSTSQSDYIDYAEQARCTYGIAPFFSTNGGVAEPKRHELSFSAKEFMGIPDPITAGKLQGTVSANPADGAFFHVFWQHLDGSTSSPLAALITVEYDAVFIEPVPVASS
jgi:hypothetical protein